VPDVVPHFGGHVTIRDSLKKKLPKKEYEKIVFRGGGIYFSKNWVVKFTYRSRSQNGGANDGLLPNDLRVVLRDKVNKKFSTTWRTKAVSQSNSCVGSFAGIARR
jgi:hypothetical protein